DGDTITPDFRFHLLVAQATDNRYFADLLSHLGSAAIPRTRINSARIADEGREQYLLRVHREHVDIYEAILRQEPDEARRAMRTHLGHSRERLQRGQVR